MKQRRYSLRVQMAMQYAAVTLLASLIFVGFNFALEGDTSGLSDALIGVFTITLIAVFAGWFIAGYALKPLRSITAQAQQISASNLDKRIGLEGPNDELQQLATTIDDLLVRLEASFERERRFVANASHEIRTPLAVTRTALELGVNTNDTEDMYNAITQALGATARSETLAADLLLLAQSESIATQQFEYIDLAELASEVVNDLANKTTAGIEITTELSSAPTFGITGLVDRLIANLIDNAILHNTPNGWVKITTNTEDNEALLRVQNSSVTKNPESIGKLFEPFQRGVAADGYKKSAGHGLGLSIVGAVAKSHNAELNATFDERRSIFDIQVRFLGSTN